MQSSNSMARHARLILVPFLMTFMLARLLVYLIMSRRIPDLYLHLGGTHVHHLNYGIFLLAGTGAYLLLGSPSSAKRSLTAVLYGIGLALTFDEFGMWYHLGGPYWQRASFDAVVVIAGIFGVVSVSPSLREFRLKDWAGTVAIVLVVTLFGFALRDSLLRAEHKLEEKLEKTERLSPS